MKKRVSVIGATGVIGGLTLDVVAQFPDMFEVVALSGGYNAARLAELVMRFTPRYVAVADDVTRRVLVDRLRAAGHPVPEIGVGGAGMVEAASLPSDVVVLATVGARGLPAAWAAIARGATVALANKETLVAAGDLVMPFARARNATILPVDSEHSALLQCLHSGRPEAVRRYILTASGGPFRTRSARELRDVTVAEALRHPTWSMGKKITIDSATLMNKGLEVIEAHHLFAASYDQIEVVIHPQSVVHSLVEFVDGALLAQLGTADMRIPIQYALTYPARYVAPWPRLDLVAMGSLTFEPPDLVRFPSLRLAYEAGRAGGYAPCVLNAANEVAVEAFLTGRISFVDIPRLVEAVLTAHPAGMPQSVEDIIEMDAWARQKATALLEEGGWVR
ncbi:1-deoxy-D-xylulose 5-phosphate reductoisomerase [Alicyclobacillus cellulosilyticus]|uniref:1-deoxy-D-xylulose 5-phosphate reductoisomerase n=1 Tax=Alicyclobacillus cellulosilyticus TaxID=1003997 RepID=A0A917K222_9BACL|nr:1-deoxy-D-xylulose-5-phosphate reductoisomerase [Alicyclobacillus cellulosilyticus]GGI94562.1 1-deoxy-D-xylulose 5-phosphate reductoisomerase [Alicyclobacillus cellulosilyticus]